MRNIYETNEDIAEIGGRIQEETRKRMEVVSYELFKICEEKGLTIAEMLELARIFPHQVKDKIKMIEQRTNFTMGHDQN